MRKGSTTQAASTRPPASAAFISGNGISMYSMRRQSPPAFSTARLIVSGPTLLRVFVATVLPWRSSALRIGLSAGTITADSAFEPVAAATLPGLTMRTGRPLARAITSEVTLDPARSRSPLTTEGSVAAPPVLSAACTSTSRPYCSKKPLAIPICRGAASAIGIEATLSVGRPPEAASVADSPPQAARTSAADAATTDPALRPLPLHPVVRIATDPPRAPR